MNIKDIKEDNLWLMNGDCLERMKEIPSGSIDIENLQFLSWFENRCKNDMSQEDWNNLKLNIQEYFI